MSSPGDDSADQAVSSNIPKSHDEGNDTTTNDHAAFKLRLASFKHEELGRNPGTKAPSSAKVQRNRPTTATTRTHNLRSAQQPSTHSQSKSTPKTSNNQNLNTTASQPQAHSSIPPRPLRPTKRKRSPSLTSPNLPLLPDTITPNLTLLIIGLNPGISTSRTGHAYAHPSNLFWKLLYKSGITSSLLSPLEDKSLPSRFNIGNTNLCSRPTKDGSSLSRGEMRDGAREVDGKVRIWRPEGVCLVGKGIWEAIVSERRERGAYVGVTSTYSSSTGDRSSIRDVSKKVDKAKGKVEFQYGWQDFRMGIDGAGNGEGDNPNIHHNATTTNKQRKPHVNEPRKITQQNIEQQNNEHNSNEEEKAPWTGAPVFVACSTSGLAASLRPAQKEEIWRELGQWVQQRRRARGFKVEGEHERHV